jgi:Trk-type K+ transport system membrane component
MGATLSRITTVSRTAARPQIAEIPQDIRRSSFGILRDPISAFSASATCLGNIGPGFAEVGPTHTMSELTIAAKLILVALMIIGRLELYTVLVAVYLCCSGSRRERW